DQLFDQAISTLSDSARRSLIRKADSRIWAAAGSIPLYQRPQLTAARKNLANTGAFGFRTPVYEDMGFLKKRARPAPGATASKKQPGASQKASRPPSNLGRSGPARRSCPGPVPWGEAVACQARQGRRHTE